MENRRSIINTGTISYKLNKAHKFRNRIFHYESICNDITALAMNHTNILEILYWINANIVAWIEGQSI